MHNRIGKENVEPQIDFCNENFSESLLPLRSKTDSETNNVQIQSESVTAEVIYQQRVRGFYQGFQTPRNRKARGRFGRVLLLFRGVWNA